MSAFGGLLAPHWRDDARGTLVGLTLGHDKRHVARAVLDGIAFQAHHTKPSPTNTPCSYLLPFLLCRSPRCPPMRTPCPSSLSFAPTPTRYLYPCPRPYPHPCT